MVPQRPFIHILIREYFYKAFKSASGFWEGKKKSIQGVFRGQKVMGLDYVTWFLLGKANKSGILFTQKSKKDKMLFTNIIYVQMVFNIRFTIGKV